MVDHGVGVDEFEASWRTEDCVVFVVHASVLENPASGCASDESKVFVEDDVAGVEELSRGEAVHKVRARWSVTCNAEVNAAIDSRCEGGSGTTSSFVLVNEAGTSENTVVTDVRDERVVQEVW